MSLRKAILLASAGAIAAFVTVSDASAGFWARHHPARTEIAGRSRFQQHRITEDRLNGSLSASQAHELRADVHGIHQEAHQDALANGGHLTPGEARQINGELKTTSGEIPR